VKCFGLSNSPLRGECLRVGLRFNIEEIPGNGLEDRVSQGIWQRESAKDIADGEKQGNVITR